MFTVRTSTLKGTVYIWSGSITDEEQLARRLDLNSLNAEWADDGSRG
jgi:hypothetical protein